MLFRLSHSSAFAILIPCQRFCRYRHAGSSAPEQILQHQASLHLLSLDRSFACVTPMPAQPRSFFACIIRRLSVHMISLWNGGCSRKRKSGRPTPRPKDNADATPSGGPAYGRSHAKTSNKPQRHPIFIPLTFLLLRFLGCFVQKSSSRKRDEWYEKRWSQDWTAQLQQLPATKTARRTIFDFGLPLVVSSSGKTCQCLCAAERARTPTNAELCALTLEV